MLRWNMALTSTNDTKVSVDKYSFAVELKQMHATKLCSRIFETAERRYNSNKQINKHRDML